MKRGVRKQPQAAPRLCCGVQPESPEAVEITENSHFLLFTNAFAGGGVLVGVQQAHRQAEQLGRRPFYTLASFLAAPGKLFTQHASSSCEAFLGMGGGYLLGGFLCLLRRTGERERKERCCLLPWGG